MAARVFQSGIEAPSNRNNSQWLIVKDNKLLIEIQAGQLQLLHPESILSVLPMGCSHYLGSYQQVPCFVRDVVGVSEEKTSWQWLSLRALLAQIELSLFELASNAYQIAYWNRTHHYCGQCGQPTQAKTHERAMHCQQCGLSQFPRISPCIIVLVTRGEELLLARAVHFPPGLFSTLAGFIEAGEAVEQAVHREVYEEVGLYIKNLRYFSSQSWPFPHSLMLGFHADYDAGSIQVDGKEIIEANWWHYQQLPLIPPPVSISRWLIDHYLSTLF